MEDLIGHRLYVGTDGGLFVLDVTPSGTSTVGQCLQGEAVRDIAPDPRDPDRALIACGLRGWGLHRTTNGGESVATVGFTEQHVWAVYRHPQAPDEVFVGTEPPGVFHRSNTADQFQSLDGIDEVPSRDRWSFFYDPFHAGHVHGFAIHPDEPKRVFAGVEIGCGLMSRDRGQAWSEFLPGADVHRITVDPSDPDHVFVATDGGTYESENGGASWSMIDATSGRYCTVVRFGPDGTEYIAGGTSGTADEGILWVREETAWQERPRVPTGGVSGVISFCLVGSTLVHAVAAADKHRLVYSDDGGRTWAPFGLAMPTVRIIAPVPHDESM